MGIHVFNKVWSKMKMEFPICSNDTAQVGLELSHPIAPKIHLSHFFFQMYNITLNFFTLKKKLEP